MTSTIIGIMEIVGPVVLLIVLIWLVMRRGSNATSDLTQSATRHLYADEEERRRKGTDDL